MGQVKYAMDGNGHFRSQMWDEVWQGNANSDKVIDINISEAWK